MYSRKSVGVKPISQIYALVLEALPGYKRARDPWYFARLRNSYENDRFQRDAEGINRGAPLLKRPDDAVNSG
jgi:hypothetical protein